MPRPFCLAAPFIPGELKPGAPFGGRKFSKVRRLRATVSGVLTVPGVLGQAFCAGLGVILTKSAKSNA